MTSAHNMPAIIQYYLAETIISTNTIAVSRRYGVNLQFTGTCHDLTTKTSFL